MLRPVCRRRKLGSAQEAVADQLRQTKQRIGIALCLRHRRCTYPHFCQSRLDRPLPRSRQQRCLLWRRRGGWDQYRQQGHPHEVAEDGAGAAGWSNTARTALDARDASAVRLTRGARAAREECPVARTGPRHRVTAPCHKWDCREARRLTEQHHAVWK